MKYSGIDLHSNNSVVTVTDDTDRVVAERRLPNDLAKIVGFLLPWRDELAGVVVESTYNWYWLVDGLQEAGFEVKLANTGAMKKYDGLKHSGDESDARQLHICCAWASCPRVRFCRRNIGRPAIWPESACNWYAVAPVTYWPSRTSWRGSGERRSTVTRSSV